MHELFAQFDNKCRNGLRNLTIVQDWFKSDRTKLNPVEGTLWCMIFISVWSYKHSRPTIKHSKSTNHNTQIKEKKHIVKWKSVKQHKSSLNIFKHSASLIYQICKVAMVTTVIIRRNWTIMNEHLMQGQWSCIIHAVNDWITSNLWIVLLYMTQDSRFIIDGRCHLFVQLNFSWWRSVKLDCTIFRP